MGDLVPGPDEVHIAFVMVRGCDPEMLTRLPLLAFLDKVVEALEMRCLGTLAIDVTGDEPGLNDPGGSSAVSVISTSHVAGHTWPERAAVNILVYSCVDFSRETLQGLCAGFFRGHAELQNLVDDRGGL